MGDEALLYAEITSTWAGTDRVASAKCAVDAGADVIIMDDGFQNPSLAKTMSILIFDGNYGVGNGYGFPAGPLREFLGSGIKRANGIVGIGQLPQSILSAARDKPVFIANTVSTPDNDDLKGKRVLAFAGIGRPQSFSTVFLPQAPTSYIQLAFPIIITIPMMRKSEPLKKRPR